MVVSNKISQIYMTIYAQEFSPCGSFLAVCNSYGEIGVYDLKSVLKSYTTKLQSFQFKFQGHEDPIFSLASNDKYLCSGSIGQIKGWHWAGLTSGSIQKPSWTINVPVDKNVGGRPEVNAMVISDNLIYAAAGDGNVYCWSLDTGALLRRLKGHSDYVHCLAMRGEDLLLSGSEDGSLRFWDPRAEDEVLVIEPHKFPVCARPTFGKWISCVDIEEDRIVCGGGPHLSLFHLKMTSVYNRSKGPSMGPLAICKSDDLVTQNVVKFHENGFASGGSSPFLKNWDMSGHLNQAMCVTPSSVYSVAMNAKTSKYPVMTVAGSSDKIDLCISRGYSSYKLTF